MEAVTIFRQVAGGRYVNLMWEPILECTGQEGFHLANLLDVLIDLYFQ